MKATGGLLARTLRVRSLLGRCLLAVAGGLALSAAFEPIAAPILLPIGLACFAIATDVPRIRTGALAGWCFGIAFYFTHIAWMRHSIGPDAWIALAGIESLAYAAAGAAMPLVRRLPAAPLWAAAVWTTMESIRSTWPFSGMPWGRISFAVIDTPLAPAVTYLGMTGLSFALALLGFALAGVVRPAQVRTRWRGRWRGRWARWWADRWPLGVGDRWAAALGSVVLLAVLLVPALAPYPIESDQTATVAAVQGNVPGPGNDILYDPRGVTANHVRATEELAADVAAGRAQRPDFVLWPENSTAFDPFADSEVNAGIREAVAAIGVPVVVGGIVDEGTDHVLNQGIVWDPATGPGDRYTKRHPVPYGEYIPFRDLWDPKFGQLALIARDMKSGTRSTPLRVAGIRVGDAICFDIAYDDVIDEQVRAGAELLTVQTSNASFIFTHQIDQQFAITRLRALEAGRSLVVASTNGISGIIGPDGEVLRTAPARTTAVLNAEVALSDTLTPAMRWGPWPNRVFTVLSLLGLVLGLFAYRRTREDAEFRSADVATSAASAPTTSEAERDGAQGSRARDGASVGSRDHGGPDLQRS